MRRASSLVRLDPETPSVVTSPSYVMEQRAETERAASQGWIRPGCMDAEPNEFTTGRLVQGREKTMNKNTKFVIQFNRLSLRLRYFVFVLAVV
jgi:hypothetical protein